VPSPPATDRRITEPLTQRVNRRLGSGAPRRLGVGQIAPIGIGQRQQWIGADADQTERGAGGLAP
jgi:hypothetical protein